MSYQYQSSHNRSSRKKEPAPEKLTGCWRVFGWFLYLFIFGIIAAVVGGVGLYWYMSNELAGAINAVIAYEGQGAGGTPRFYDRNGVLLFEMPTTEKRKHLAFADIPENIKLATVAIEDDTFWTNPGFDPAAIGAAVLYNYQNQDGRPVGASTITQQLVRHIAFEYEERVSTSYERKIREIFLAGILTRQRSKEDILEMYLNEIYYGNLAYGIEAAAQTYFGKPAADLNLAEAAFLAGLPQAPIYWNPYVNFEGAKERQELILDIMLADGTISDIDAQVAKLVTLRLRPLIAETPEGSRVLLAPHFVLYVQNEIERRFGPDALVRGGWQVTTSLDWGIQQAAEQAIRDQVALRSAEHNVHNGSAVVLKPSTGEILGMVGSVDYFNVEVAGQINMTLAPRQPGSSFKPITYVAAMEKGWGTADVLWDVPIELEVGYEERMTPVNYDGRYHGPILFRDALANSYNIPPLQLARDVGLPTLIQTARKMGVVSLNQTPNYYGLSLTLGGGEVPLLEMTHAFATLANQGRMSQLTGIVEIKDSEGRLVYESSSNRIPGNQVIDAGIAYIISDILDDDRARIPAMGANSPLELPFPAAVKTGTTNDFRDNLTIGYTPYLVVGVWMGNTDSTPMRDSSGLRTAAPVWNRIMQEVVMDGELGRALLVDGLVPVTAFEPPPNVQEITVCLPRGTGGGSCSSSRQDWAIAGGATHGVGRLGFFPDVQTNPGAWTLTVLPMTAEAQANVNLQVLDNGFAPPPPSHCVTNSGRSLEGAQTRLFLPIPPFYPDEVRARLWNDRNGGYQMAPPIACPTSILRGASPASSASGGSSGGNTVLGSQSTGGGGSSSGSGGGSGWRISSPGAGARVSGSVPIVGTAADPNMQYYKLEIGAGTNPSEWTTFGTTHSGPVTNGTLETLSAGALAPGPYVIRLVVVMQDGNFSNPYTVPITIE